MKTVREILGHVWSTFRRHGIADDLLIIQHIAELLADAQPALEEASRPSPSKLNSWILSDISNQLEEAAQLAGDKAKLFDQHVLFSLPNILAGGRYPTPRHLVACMHRISSVQPAHSLADLACGSGGFLVRAATAPVASAKRVGVEISGDWARLAQVNARLHGIEAMIITANALLASAPSGTLGDEQYDRILMNPPFGELMDPSLVQGHLASKKVGVRSEVILVNLALDRLAKGGRAAIMVPQRVLFAKGTEGALRQRFVDEFHLESVIELPRDALQPYSSVQAHIMLLSNHSPRRVAPTWFFRVEEDGYPSGRARDLTEVPNGPSDLPFVEAILGGATRKHSETQLLQVELVTDDKGERIGLVICASESAKLISILELREKRGHWLVVTVEVSDEKSVRGSTHWISLDTGQLSVVESQENILKNGSTESLLQEGVGVVAAAISLKDVRLLGVAVTNEALRASYDLRPDEYLTRPVQKIVDASPAELLARIRANQQSLSKQLDELLGQLELNPVIEQRLPPALDQKGVAPFGTLSDTQLQVWKKILEKTESWAENDSKYEIAVHFTVNEVDPSGTEASPSTRATLALFERMGLIVTVTISPPPRSEPAVVYRRTTQRDLWEPE